ncbi:MAG: hypothetical protein HUJ51_02650 [Eggerthellaceae bacterium]|nr:hypothetical protein [Eggerthellaceae bacterium]
MSEYGWNLGGFSIVSLKRALLNFGNDGTAKTICSVPNDGYKFSSLICTYHNGIQQVVTAK